MISKLTYPHVWVLLSSILIADWAVALLIPFAHRIGAVDRPHSYKIHREPVPFLGGVGLFAGFAIALFTILTFPSFDENLPIAGILLGSVVIMTVGCLDDFRHIAATVKLAILFGVTVLLQKFDVTLSLTGWPAIDVTLTLFWIAGVSSAMNSIDNMDGAALGISAIASFFAFLIAWYSFQTRFSFLSIALCGACVGALRHNFKPARTFIGNGGSLLLGFLLSATMVHGGWSADDPWKAILLPCVILVVPLYDITLSTVLRCRSGVVRTLREAIVYCGKDHLSHRLVALGLSEREAVLTLYLFGIAGGIIGYSLAPAEVGPAIYWPVVAAGIVVLGGVGVLLDHADVYGTRGESGPSKEGRAPAAEEYAPPPSTPAPPPVPGA
jgi:UDP-GlcNAc:undecaprenyl-phosphate GlcNAc-1-phosphate transferase